MPNNYNLPFELNAESIDQWLMIVDKLPHAEKVNQLNRMINELSNMSVDAMRLFPVLDKLTEPFLMLSKIFERMATSENNPSEKSRKLASFAIQLPKKLCFAYCKLADDRSATNAQRLLSIYRAMQILCLLIKRNTLFYEAPDLTLWKKLAELYLKAKEGNLLTVDIDDKVPGLVEQPTIEAVLKHALLFYICNAYQYSPSAISDLFAAVAGLARLIKLDNDPSEFTLCYWNPAAQLPPQSVNQGPGEDQALYIDTSALADYFEAHQDQLKSCQALVPSLKRLTAYADIRRSVEPSAQKECGLIIGIAQAMKFLNVLTSRYRILELSGTFGDQNLSSKLELVPLDDGKNALAFLSTKILKDETSLSFAKIKTFQTNNSKFCTAKIGNLGCSMDEPVILVYENQRPYFAIIRHIRTEAGIKLKTILMEIIDGVVYPVEIDGNQGFVLIGSHGKAELFLPPANGLINNSAIFSVKLISDKTFRIEKFVETTACFSRYRASVC